MNPIEIGRLLRASTRGCVVGSQVQQGNAPVFGAMVSIPLDETTQIYGLVHDLQIKDDGLVRQLVTAGNIRPEVIEDNRQNRNVPLEISVVFIGYQKEGRMLHLLPPRPPLSLDAIYPCAPGEICAFTSAGRFGYFRHILSNLDLPISDLLAAHLVQVDEVQKQKGNSGWLEKAVQELIVLLRDDYATLNTTLNAIADIEPLRSFSQKENRS